MNRAAYLALTFILTSACPYGGPHGDQSQNAPAKTTTTTSNPRAGEDRSATANPIMPQHGASAASVETKVELTEYSILIPPTLTAGHQRLTIVNSGKQNHNFVIEGNGVSAKLPEDLTRGDSTHIEIDLKPGTYDVWCPVDGHRGKGMQTTVTVK